MALFDPQTQQEMATLRVLSWDHVEWIDFQDDGDSLRFIPHKGILAWRAPSFVEIEAAEKAKAEAIVKAP